MAKHIEKGKQGESLAARFLYDLGYHIMATNWRYKRAEIDIIARDGDIVVFVEVKTKSYNFYGDPSESVSAKKERLLIDAASEYCTLFDHNWEIRFDIVSVIIGENGHTTIEHFKDAFYPGLE